MSEFSKERKPIQLSELIKKAKDDHKGLAESCLAAWGDLIDIKRGHTQSGLPRDIEALAELAKKLGYSQEELDAAALKTYANKLGYEILSD